MTDWNRHHGVGETLLENWVEERAVGERILDERSSMARLQRQGHGDILTHHSKTPVKLITTHQETFDVSAHPDPNKSVIGKRRQLIEAELMKRAMKELDEPPIDRSAREWMSTAHHDFSSEVKTVDLGKRHHSKDECEKLSNPITFWTHHAEKGEGTVICSASPTEISTFGKFGRHTTFSTPIQELKKS
ncbi:hypothetical protein DFJ73DRAFT_813324 [Zopfochytrium polystomum]|nr:hypothetical protein DFJ73DRAFT_813324 [Zopfochytrium polystomum]